MNHDFPTPQGPTPRSFRPLVTPAEEDEQAARRPVHAGMLQANIEHHVYITGSMYSADGGAYSPEEDLRGWSAQQPFSHVDCDVMHLCVFCAKMVDPDFLRAHDCRVLLELAR